MIDVHSYYQESTSTQGHANKIEPVPVSRRDHAEPIGSKVGAAPVGFLNQVIER
jgi:hypothetical protein